MTEQQPTSAQITTSVLPSTSTIVDTMVATTLCKSIGEGFVGSAMTPKNIGYLVLLSSIPDIKKLILDSITAVKTYIFNNFKTIISNLSHNQLFQVLNWFWKKTFGYLFNKLFTPSPEPFICNDIIEDFVPIQPRFETEFKVNFGDNLQIIENMVDIIKKNNYESKIVDMNIVNKNSYQYSEYLSEIYIEQDELSIKFDEVLKLKYDVVDDKKSLKEFNGCKVKQIGTYLSEDEQKLVEELGLTVTEKPDKPKKLTDLFENRVIAAFMDSEEYVEYSSKATTYGLKIKNTISKDSTSIFKFDFTGKQSHIVKYIKIICNKINKIYSDLYAINILVDLIICSCIFSDKKILRINIKNNILIVSVNKYELIKIKLKENEINDGLILDNLCLFPYQPLFYSECGILKFKVKLLYIQFLKLYGFYFNKNIEDEIIVKNKTVKNTNLTFCLSTLNPTLDLISTFRSQFLEPLTKSIQETGKKITVYTVKIESEKTETKKPNPEYIKYMKKKEEIESLIESSKGSNKLLNILAKQDIPDEEIEIVETSDKVVCTTENTLSKPLDTLYLRKEDYNNLRSILHNFKNSKELYEELGLRRKIGIMLYGIPGTGKSTTIIATATYLNYDIYYITVSNINTNRQFKMIIDYINDIAIRGGIIVMEDIDAQSTVFHKRTTSPTDESIISLTERVDDKLDLSYILNMFDGTLSRDNNVFMFTTNHIEKIDPAVYRTGRVDALIEMKCCDHYQINMIYTRILRRDLDPKLLEIIPENKWTPADIIFHLVKYYYQPDVSDEEILSRFIEK
jgi:SpoVK/Ycf46/Vps4 family AAA+-type ATPase